MRGNVIKLLNDLTKLRTFTLKSQIRNAKINNKQQNLAKSSTTNPRIIRQDKHKESNYVQHACKHVAEQGVGNGIVKQTRWLLVYLEMQSSSSVCC